VACTISSLGAVRILWTVKAKRKEIGKSIGYAEWTWVRIA
jgi:hypothetical protein